MIFFKKIIEEVFDFISIEIKNNDNFNSRQVASALYYLCSSVFLNEESRFCSSLIYRNKISKLLIQHKLMKRNPIIVKEDIVYFVEIQIVEDTVDGLWVTGLPEKATVITVGQE